MNYASSTFLLRYYVRTIISVIIRTILMYREVNFRGETSIVYRGIVVVIWFSCN